MSPEAQKNAHVPDMEKRARQFVSAHTALFRVKPTELVLNPSSGPLDEDHYLLTFDRQVGGIPVEDQRFILYVTRGNVVAFGADRWGKLIPLQRKISADRAREALYAHMGISARDAVVEVRPNYEVYVASRVGPAGRWKGDAGAGVTFRRAWRFTLRVEGERGTWVGKVDSATGAVIALYDDSNYEQVKGGVYPVSNDLQCPDGCEQPGWPMPYADVSVDGGPQTPADDMGLFTCAGTTATTTLTGAHVQILDMCKVNAGEEPPTPIIRSATCGGDLNLQVWPATQCQTPIPPYSYSVTHAAERSTFYHLNRAMEKGRVWLPTNTALQGQVVAQVNVDQECLSDQAGNTLSFGRGRNECRNTGEIGGVILHEWGHWLDNHDGDGQDDEDRPSEAYGDVVAFLQTHQSCVGRGNYLTHTCSGYGNECVSCTGLRDQDWAAREDNIPTTISRLSTCSEVGFKKGPCQKEAHCESYLAGETLWDLAVRDLPAPGLDAATAWQITEKLFYKSRQGSAGDAYYCELNDGISNGCGSGSWFTKLRVIDDDDGNLLNGTPHAAAIFAAFDRHGIACGPASLRSNRNSYGCPPLPAPVLTVSSLSDAASLSWTAVPAASKYLVLRNDQSCNTGNTIIATVAAPVTTYTDTNLPQGIRVYYRVQAQGSNTACESSVSNCSHYESSGP